QLPYGGPDALAQLDVELNGSDSIFVGIHELPPGSPSFCPHPRWVRFAWKSTLDHLPEAKTLFRLSKG
ncbi:MULTISPECIES: hypothetical protein, partial [Acidovorax]|uniref:hypothetical protein n=1 Tax=Acidovorax TaxID=12916 RepID=UPI001EE496D2